MYTRLRGILRGKNSEGEEGEAEKARSGSFLIESTCFKIQHDGIELCVSMTDMHTRTYIFRYTHIYVTPPFVQQFLLIIRKEFLKVCYVFKEDICNHLGL